MRHLASAAFSRLFSGPPLSSRSGPGVFIRRPRRVEGAEHMIFGERVRIASNAWLAAYTEYYHIAIRHH
jgi:hypothetical protein